MFETDCSVLLGRGSVRGAVRSPLRVSIRYVAGTATFSERIARRKGGEPR